MIVRIYFYCKTSQQQANNKKGAAIIITFVKIPYAE